MKISESLAILLTGFVMTACGATVYDYQDQLLVYQDKLIVSHSDQVTFYSIPDLEVFTNISADAVFLSDSLYIVDSALVPLSISSNRISEGEPCFCEMVLDNGNYYYQDRMLTELNLDEEESTVVYRLPKDYSRIEMSGSYLAGLYGDQLDILFLDDGQVELNESLEGIADFTFSDDSPYVYYSTISNKVYSYQYYSREMERLETLLSPALNIKLYADSAELLLIADSAVYLYSLEDRSLAMGQETVIDAELDTERRRLYLLEDEAVRVLSLDDYSEITNSEI